MPEIRVSQPRLQRAPVPPPSEPPRIVAPAPESDIRSLLAFAWKLRLRRSRFSVVDGPVRALHIWDCHSDCNRVHPPIAPVVGSVRAALFLHCRHRSSDRPEGLLGPGQRAFQRLPFVYGTLVSSFWLCCCRVPLAIGLAIFLTEMCPKIAAHRAGLPYGTSGGHSQHYLWLVGHVRAGPLLREHVNPC